MLVTSISSYSRTNIRGKRSEAPRKAFSRQSNICVDIQTGSQTSLILSLILMVSAFSLKKAAAMERQLSALFVIEFLSDKLKAGECHEQVVQVYFRIIFFCTFFTNISDVQSRRHRRRGL